MKNRGNEGKAPVSDYEEYLKSFAARMDGGDWKGAFELARQRFDRNKTPGSLVHLCDALLAGRDYARFEAHLQRLIGLEGDPAEVLRLRALYAAAIGKPGAAITLWLRYSKLKPGKPAPILRAAELCLRHARFTRLPPLLDRLRRKWPDHELRRPIEDEYAAAARGESEPALRQRAVKFTEARQWEEARKAWESLFAKSPRNPGVLFRIGDCLMEQGDFVECCEIITLYLDDVKQSARFPDVCRRMLIGLAKSDEIATVDDRLLAELSPTALLAALNIAAARSADEGVAILASHLEKRADGVFLREAARELIAREHLDLARRLLDLARLEIPDDAELAFVALSLAWKTGDLDECRSYLDRLRLAPSTMASSIEAFGPYLIAHHNILGPDAFLTAMASAAVGDGMACPGMVFDLIDRLYIAGERGPLTFLLREASIGDTAARESLDFFGSVFLDVAERGPADDLRLFDGFADAFAQWAARDQKRFSRMAEVLLEQDRLSLLELVLEHAAPNAQDDIKLSRVRAQIAQKSNRWAQAAELWLKVLGANPNDGWARINWTHAVIRGGDRAAGRAAFDQLQASKEMRSGPIRSELVPLATRLGDLEAAKRLALDVLDNAAAQDLRPHQRLQIARTLSLVGLPELAWPLYGVKKLTKPAGAVKLGVILDPGLTRTSGHHVNYNVFAWRLIGALVGEGVGLTPLVLCRETVADTPELRDARIAPVLNFEAYAFDDLPVVHQCFAGLNASFYYDLSRLDLRDDVGVVFMHSMRATMVDGFSRWIEDIFRNSKGYVVVGLIEVDHIMQNDEIVSRVREIYRSALDRLTKIRNIGLLIYVETESGEQFLHSLGVDGLDVRIYPYLAASLCLSYRKEPDGNTSDVIRLGMVGGTGDRRGSHLIPKLVANTQDLAPCLHWKLQLNMTLLRAITKSEDIRYATTLHDFAHVDVVDKVLSLREYFELLDEIDVVVLPYQERYAVSGSGVLYESIYMGKFLIVPRDTFMPAVLAALKHPHMVIEEASDACLERAVRKVVADRVKIKQRLLALRRSRPKRLPSDEFYRLVSTGVHARLTSAPPARAPTPHDVILRDGSAS